MCELITLASFLYFFWEILLPVCIDGLTEPHDIACETLTMGSLAAIRPGRQLWVLGGHRGGQVGGG